MRGDQVKALKLPDRRVTTSRSARIFGSRGHGGFTLIEMVITLTVLSILTLGVVPLMKLSVKRQKEEELRVALRQMRMAIDEFRRDTVGMPRTGLGNGVGTSGGIGGQGGQGGQGGNTQVVDPRSKVYISDPTIFGVDNPDLYPPDLETLVNGVNVMPRAGQGTGGRGLQSSGTSSDDTTSQLGNELSTKKKVYLRKIPIDPMTGEADWDFRSCYDSADADSWGGENVFDVRSKSKGTALNGEKYSDW